MIIIVVVVSVVAVVASFVVAGLMLWTGFPFTIPSLRVVLKFLFCEAFALGTPLIRHYCERRVTNL